jgi:hypothetical protein
MIHSAFFKNVRPFVVAASMAAALGGGTPTPASASAGPNLRFCLGLESSRATWASLPAYLYEL